jgi:hypothetical protein
MKKFNAKIFKNLNYKTKQLKNNLITQIISHLITMQIDISIDPYQYIMEELKSITYSLNNTKFDIKIDSKDSRFESYLKISWDIFPYMKT